MHVESEKKILESKLVTEAKTYFESIVSTREWNAELGGVYVKKSHSIEANPYLKDNNFTANGINYIKINPAWMTRQISEINNKKNSVKYKITSLNPINPLNIAEGFDKKALQYLEEHRDDKYFYKFIDEDSEMKFKFLGKLDIERSCLNCHAYQGYQEGDIKGGISVELPVDSYIEALQSLNEHGKHYSILIYIIIILLTLSIVLIIHISYKREKINRELQKQIQENRLKTDVMLTQSRQVAMEEIVSMLAHQWRQPVSVIAMEINTILADIAFDALNKDELKKNLGNISNKIQELSKTIDDFQEFFRPKSEKEITDISVVVEKVVYITGKSLEDHNITLKKELLSEFRVNTYIQELSQIFILLIENSKDALIKNRESNRWIVIKVDEDESKESIRVSIEDNGGGIDRAIINRIFEPYFSTKEEKNDIGLGLYIVKIILEKHIKGRIEVANTKDGVKFTLILPIKVEYN